MACGSAAPRAIEIATEGARVRRASIGSTVGAAMLGSSTEPGALEALIAAALKTREGREAAMRCCGRWSCSDPIRRCARRRRCSPRQDPSRAGALCRLKSFRRVAPGEELATAFTVEHSRRAGRRHACGTARRRRTPPNNGLPPDCSSDDAAVRYAAVESGLCLRIDQAWKTATQMAGQRTSAAGALSEAAGAVRDRRRAGGRLRRASRPGAAGAGDLGAGSHRDRARRRRVRGRHAARAARACLRRGLLLDHGRRSRARSSARQGNTARAPAFEDDDLEANLVPPPEALWPMPDAEAVQKHWLALRVRTGPRTCVTSTASRPTATRCWRPWKRARCCGDLTWCSSFA